MIYNHRRNSAQNDTWYRSVMLLVSESILVKGGIKGLKLNILQVYQPAMKDNKRERHCHFTSTKENERNERLEHTPALGKLTGLGGGCVEAWISSVETNASAHMSEAWKWRLLEWLLHKGTKS